MSWRHGKAHRFFSQTTWCLNHVDMIAACLVITVFAPQPAQPDPSKINDGAPVWAYAMR